ncbi:MAG: YdeI/OmpD-associated family protein [Phycisphaerales bacterium]|nr:MAG: YdeI/OmpD-associated family protein [Phycisphaerales bacterium]
MKQVYVKTRDEWRDWLNQHQYKSAGIWLVFYKKHTGKPSLEYDAAVEEALCFGWIDSIIKKIDDERYVRKFTPRNPNSRWSELNKKRIKKLMRQGLMTQSGIAIVTQAKESGLWEKPDRPTISLVMPKELASALAKNKKAKKSFDQLAPTYQKHFIGWISVAKRQETKNRRVRESIALLAQGKKLGLK